MEPVILICCIASVIISTYGVIKSKKPDNSEVEKKLDVMSQTSNNQSNMLSNQLNQQNETLVNGMTTLGKEESLRICSREKPVISLIKSMRK